MKLLERLFLILLARARRKLGGRDLETAWHRAFNAFSSYLVLPTIAAVGLVMLSFRVLAEPGVRSINKLPWQIGGMLVLGGVYVWLYRRFQKYSHYSPNSPPAEPAADTLFIRWSRVISIGTFVLVFVSAILIYLS